MRRICRIATAMLLLLVAVCPVHAAARRPWVALTDCRYVTAKDNDGDSFRVRCASNEFNLQLYFVDAPEANLRYPERTRQQSEYFGVTLDQTIKAGAGARDTVEEMLQEPFVVVTRWANAAGRGRETRYYALVEVDGRDMAEILVAHGLARNKGVFVNLPTGEKANLYVERLEAMEREARQKRLGIWASSPEHTAETRRDDF
jgi:endonuclease YncB( thermonuclease family)